MPAEVSIDDIIVQQLPEHVALDVRIRNGGDAVANVTRAELRIEQRVPFAAQYTASAGYDLLVSGETNETVISHKLDAGEVDGFILRLGFSKWNTSCGFRARLALRYNGGDTSISEPFGFSSTFESKRRF